MSKEKFQNRVQREVEYTNQLLVDSVLSKNLQRRLTNNNVDPLDFFILLNTFLPTPVLAQRTGLSLRTVQHLRNRLSQSVLSALP